VMHPLSPPAVTLVFQGFNPSRRIAAN